MNRYQGTSFIRLCSLPGRYDNPIPTQFLTPIDCLKTPALKNLPQTLLTNKKQRTLHYVHTSNIIKPTWDSPFK